jgi:hypothetical protein
MKPAAVSVTGVYAAKHEFFPECAFGSVILPMPRATRRGLVGEAGKGTVHVTGKNLDTGLVVNGCGLFPCRAWQPLAGTGGRIRRDLHLQMAADLLSYFV